MQVTALGNVLIMSVCSTVINTNKANIIHSFNKEFLMYASSCPKIPFVFGTACSPVNSAPLFPKELQ